MGFPLRPIAFVLAACNHGSMIVNRNDYMVEVSHGVQGVDGVGFQILHKSSFDETEVGFALALLDCRRRHFGDGVVAIDGGANIGVHSVEWARHMYSWGRVIGFEAQEVVYYALAGNIALNNCLNARVRLAALGERCGELAVPQPNYFTPASFGSLELRQHANTQFIGQPISYDPSACSTVPMINLDSLGLNRLDLVKLDVEGMELDVLRGGRTMLARHHPVMIIEVLKSDRAALEALVVELGYRVFPMGMINILAIHVSDPTLHQVTLTNNQLTLTG
jgi:FkbM family methyltransferase